MILRGKIAIRLAAIAGLVGAALLGAACPPSKPPVQHPDADAAPAPVVHATCKAAATHYARACLTSDADTSELLCGNLIDNKADYPDCLMKAANCDDGDRCDNMAGVKRPPPHGPIVNGR